MSPAHTPGIRVARRGDEEHRMSGIGDKAGDFLKSDKGEQISDGVLDKAGDKADAATGGGHKDQVDKAQQAADTKLGS